MVYEPKLKRHCVYFWYKRGESRPFYIGSGRYNRAMASHPNQPCGRYRAELEASGDFMCVIPHTGLSRKDSLTVEKGLILQYRPSHNVNKGRHSRDGKGPNG